MSPVQRTIRLFQRLYTRSGLEARIPHSTKTRLRGIWIRVAWAIGYPISSPQVPRPPLARRRSRMRLGRALMACDLNPDYLEFWPHTRRAWREIVGLEPTLVLVAEEADIPANLREDETVVLFQPIPELHSAFQAQCIRLLYPALVDTRDAVLISDVDLYPLRSSYFHAPVAKLDASFFVTYRDTRLGRGEVPMLYNAAAPATWSEIFRVETLDDVQTRLSEWWGRVEYEGRRGGGGWYTDQHVLYEYLMSWPGAAARWWMLDDDYCRYNQLDRRDLAREDGLESHRRADLRAQRYTDFVCPIPYRAHQELNDLVLEIGLEAARRPSGR